MFPCSLHFLELAFMFSTNLISLQFWTHPCFLLVLTFREKNHCRYRPPKHPQYDLALVKVIKPIKFSEQVMPICLPPSTKFPDHKGTVYVAGWGLHHEAQEESKCTTGDKGPDPFSKCKFPFFWYTQGSIPHYRCLGTNPPSQQGCEELLKLKQRKNESANMLDKNYGRVST